MANETNKVHRCMRCLEEFACELPDHCQANLHVLPNHFNVQKKLIEHCPMNPDWDWIRAYGKRRYDAARADLQKVEHQIRAKQAMARIHKNPPTKSITEPSARDWYLENRYYCENRISIEEPVDVDELVEVLEAYATYKLHRVAADKEVIVATSGIEYEHKVDAWLSEKVREGRGAVILCETEGGDIGVFVGDSEKSLGTGDTVFEAVSTIERKAGK